MWNQILQQGFALLYNELAWTYDLVSWLASLGQWRNWQRAALPFIEGNDVLEVGHGPGHMLSELGLGGYKITGLDLSKSMGRIATKRLLEADITASLVRGQAQELPFADEVFDSILATFPTPFIVDPETIRQFNRVLRDSGQLVVVAEARLTSGGFLRVFIEWLYAITGQRQISNEENSRNGVWEDIQHRYLVEGFHLRREEVNLGESIVTVIIANKKTKSEKL